MTLRRLVAVALIGVVPLFQGGCTDDRVVTVDPYDPADRDPDAPGSVAPELPGMFVRAFRSPLRIAAAPDALLLTDSRHRLVIQVDPGTLTYQRGIYIEGKPLGIAYRDRFILVGNATKETVEVYDGRGGSLLSDFGRGAVGYPSDIAVDEEEALVFVVDGADGKVKVFDPSGRRIRTIPGSGGTGRLANPISVAVDRARKEVLVSDYGTLETGAQASVQIYGYDGTFRAEISGGACSGGSCGEGFSRPQGLAVGLDGRIYLADALLAKILIFERASLSLVGEIGASGFTRLPTDVVVGAEGDLFVVGNLSRDVKVVRRATAR